MKTRVIEENRLAHPWRTKMRSEKQYICSKGAVNTAAFLGECGSRIPGALGYGSVPSRILVRRRVIGVHRGVDFRGQAPVLQSVEWSTEKAYDPWTKCGRFMDWQEFQGVRSGTLWIFVEVNFSSPAVQFLAPIYK